MNESHSNSENTIVGREVASADSIHGVMISYKAQMGQTKKHFQKVKVMGQFHLFSPEDEILKRNRKLVVIQKTKSKSPKRGEEECRICSEPIRNGKSRTCEFCWGESCYECSKTLRRFPKQIVIEDSGEEPERHTACKVCVAKLEMKYFYFADSAETVHCYDDMMTKY